MTTQIQLSPQKIRNTLLVSSGFLCLLSLFADALRLWVKAGALGGATSLTGKAIIYNIAPFFNVGEEVNLPTFYSSFLLLATACCCFAAANAAKIGLQKKTIKRSWHFLGLIFVGLSIDEFSSFHEKLNRIMVAIGNYIFIPRLMQSVWYASAMAACLVLLFLLIPLLKSLSPKVKNLFGLSGLIFIGGAVGLEAVSLIVMDGSPEFSFNFYYLLLSTLEELLEMAGVSLAIYAILVYISEKTNSFQIVF